MPPSLTATFPHPTRWRYSHNEEKARYDKYYASLKNAGDDD